MEMNGILKKYYKRNVEVTNAGRKRNARYVMERVSPIFQYIRSASNAIRGDLIYIGSAYSGTKVGKADEFDLHASFKLPKDSRKN